MWKLGLPSLYLSRGSSTCCMKTVQIFCTVQLKYRCYRLFRSEVASGGYIRRKLWATVDPLLYWSPAHLCSSTGSDHRDNYAINTVNEKEVSHATFHWPRHSHILTGLRMKFNPWHHFPSNPKVLPSRVKLFHTGGTPESRAHSLTKDVLLYI